MIHIDRGMIEETIDETTDEIPVVMMIDEIQAVEDLGRETVTGIEDTIHDHEMTGTGGLHIEAGQGTVIGDILTSIPDRGHVAGIERTARGRVGVTPEIASEKMEVIIKSLLTKMLLLKKVKVTQLIMWKNKMRRLPRERRWMAKTKKMMQMEINCIIQALMTTQLLVRV